MLFIPQQYSSLSFLQPISWEDVFAIWREGEANRPEWQKHWQERGYDSWDEWRDAYAAPLHPMARQWSLYRVKDPLKDIPNFYGVPSRGWIDKAYGGQTTWQLKDIISLQLVTNNQKIKEIKDNFPQKTMLTGLVHGHKIVLIEGMHRACAIASWDQTRLFNSMVLVALTPWENNEIPVMGGHVKEK